MTSQELRASFVDFFVSKSHRHLPAATLIPDAMSTTLFTIAGMEQFVPVFLGEAPAPAPRAVTVQRCLRVAGAKSDIENVGRTGRHGTFLEMLGNFSFGDYYKREAILFAWEYLTQHLKLDEDRLFVTIHTSDDEAQRLWEYEVGLASSRITRFDEDNFWTMGSTGPCGPCSEIFYDNGPEHATGPEDRGPNLGGRFVEIWNLVFQQYNRTADGTLSDLPRTAIDTGAGFERMLAVANGKVSMYETDLFMDLVAAQPRGTTNFGPDEALVRRRIIADHARATTFLVADGVVPSNTDRGYVLRFLIRRAVRSGRLLGYPPGFLAELVGAVVVSLAPGYPALVTERSRVAQAIGAEEAAFERTLERGSEMLDRLIAQAKTSGAAIAGADVFTLHDTFGFPSELTREIANEADVDVDMASFSTAMEEQRDRAREDAARKRRVVSHASEADGSSGSTSLGRSTFEGYEALEAEGTVRAILVDGKPVSAIDGGGIAQIVLDRTAFYAEKGGQIGDRGTLETGTATFEVSDAQYAGDAIAHAGTLHNGRIAVGDVVRSKVFSRWREEVRRHHTSAHLLQRALKDVLGDEVSQAGSWVGADRMRFDFRSPGGALSHEQRQRVAARVNEMIRADYPRNVRELPIAEAVKTGAVTMAGEKYGDRVRVMEFGPSVEFCGGTHAHSTGELGLFVMLGESSIGSGIRRIEGIVSKAAESFVTTQQDLVGSLAESLSTKPEGLVDRVARLQVEMRDMQRALAEIRARLASSDAQAYAERAETIAGRLLVAATVREANAEATRTLANAIRSRVPSGVVALVGIDGTTVTLFVSVSADLVAEGVHAGHMLKRAAAPVEGRGGGAAAQAQGGGKNPGGAEAALAEIRAALAE